MLPNLVSYLVDRALVFLILPLLRLLLRLLLLLLLRFLLLLRLLRLRLRLLLLLLLRLRLLSMLQSSHPRAIRHLGRFLFVAVFAVLSKPFDH